jgi:tetratricopeptide (TPR) repeat protein
MRHETEMGNWLIILALATAFVLGLAVAVGAADLANRPPGLLPPKIGEWAVPMPREESLESPAGDLDDPACRLWGILDLHRAGSHEAAIRDWNELSLTPETSVWKWIALAQASIATGQLEQAERLLDRAMKLEPENAVAFYFRGVLRLQQASLAHDWPDEFGLPRTRLTAFTPRSIVPNTKSMYELAATADFETCIELAPLLQIGELIVTDGCTTAAVTNPTVADLLVALGADNFEAKAHLALGRQFLERGAPDVAEQHFDSAVEGGLDVAAGYRRLVDEYLACGRHVDALRAYVKAVHADDEVDAIVDAVRGCYEHLMR